MDGRDEIREFLISRRARLTPEMVGLPSYGARRVPGLRREEVAVLAGISVPYYARLERGDLSNASSGVIDSLARALRLDDAERTHLFDLSRAANPLTPTPEDGDAVAEVRPAILQLLEAITAAAAFVCNDRLEVLGANRLGYALCGSMFAPGARTVNLARFTLLDPAARDFFVDWGAAASGIVAGLRASAGRNPGDRKLAALVDELAARSEAFRTRWATHDVLMHPSGVKKVRHPLVGELELNYEQLTLPTDPRRSLFTYSAPADSAAASALAFLGNWSDRQPIYTIV
jgi:transcriptional regulator with XRE-family HTH domain